MLLRQAVRARKLRPVLHKKPASMEDAVAAFREYLEIERVRSKRTVQTYVPVIEALVDFLPCDAEGRSPSLASLGQADLRRFLREQARSTGAPSKVLWNVRLAALRSFYQYLFKAEVVDVNPALRIDRFKVAPPPRIPLNLDEMLTLVETIEQWSPTALVTRNVAIALVFMHCGLRVQEVSALRVDQVDVQRDFLVGVRTKGSKRLSAPMNDVVREALEKYLARDRAALLFPTDPEDVPELFVTGEGKGIAIRTVEELIRSYAKKAGISRAVTPHLLRHSSATELVEDPEFALEDARDFLNHESVKTTELYIHRSPSRQRKAVTALGRKWRARAAVRSARPGTGTDG